MTAPACTTCKFYKDFFWFSVRAPVCTNTKCDEKAWEFRDNVTGEVRKYEQRNAECYKARWGACGANGILWEPR